MEFKVGDKVRIKRSIMEEELLKEYTDVAIEAIINLIGVVVIVKPPLPLSIGVDWGIEFKDGHRLGDLLSTNRGHWIHSTHLAKSAIKQAHEILNGI